MASISGIVAGLIVAIPVYLMFRRLNFETILRNSVEDIIEDVSNDEKLQRNIYNMGVLLGNGAKGGLGLSRGKGKFSLTDLIMNAAGQFIEKKMGSSTESNKSPFENQ